MNDPGNDYHRALEATRQHHAKHKTFSGRFLFRYVDQIKPIIERHGCKTMLDYGCGKGIQYEQPMDSGVMIKDFLGVDITLFDPGVPEFSKEPQGKFDLVIMTQALGSVPKSGIPYVVDRLYGFATKAIYVAERLKPVKKMLHKHMDDAMPRDWKHDDWANALRRPNSPVACYLRTKDYFVEGPAVSRLEELNGRPA